MDKLSMCAILPFACRCGIVVFVSELTSVPPGWQAIAWPAAWRPDQTEGELDLEQVGYVLLPTRFTLCVVPPVDLFKKQDAESDPAAFFISFEVVTGELICYSIYGPTIDLTKGLEILIKNVPPERWEPLAIAKITEFLAFEEVRHVPRNVQQRVASSAVRQFGSTGSQRGGKRRITIEHLAEVATIYKLAKEEGKPPTRAVQERFSVSHSTAAKWVGAARRENLLPPARTRVVGE